MGNFSKGRLAGILFGLAFVGLVVYSAVSSMTGSKRGTGTPEGAVELLFDAMSREDVIGVMSVMAPFEVGTSADLYPRAVDLAVAADIIEDANWLAGIDFEAEDLEMSTTVLHPDVALVGLARGEFALTLDPATADPLFTDTDSLHGSITLQEAHRQLSSAIWDANAEIGDFPFTLRAPDELFVMTVKHDGKWFVSASYTAAEYGRQILDLPPADFSASRDNAASGATTPSGVIDDLVEMVNSRSIEEHWDAILSGDPDGVFEPFNVFSPPDELGALLDYAPAYNALVDQMEEWLADDGLGLGVEAATEMLENIELEGDVSLSVTTREVPIDDEKSTVYLESGSISTHILLSNQASDESVFFQLEATWEGLCARGFAGFDYPLNPGSSGFAEFNECLPQGVLPYGLDEVFVIVTETNGYWYISYVETILAYAEIYVAEALRRPELRSRLPEVDFAAAPS
ncbi:hypothetical protein [Candidatus Poriferisocius sp.]|uniref:hypothetical protein n=1 Tax=Candidatus Poriferisocius sp. TaxID=3101276 RepID=UPI003B019658